MLGPLGVFAGSPLVQLLVALVAIAIILVVARIILSIAWRITLIAVVIVAALYLLSTLGVI